MKTLILLVICLTGCVHTSITQLSPRENLSNCTPKMFTSLASAEKSGVIGEEVCMITIHAPNIGKALEAAPATICSCGVSQGYVKTTSDSDPLMEPHIIVVGFDYKK